MLKWNIDDVWLKVSSLLIAIVFIKWPEQAEQAAFISLNRTDFSCDYICCPLTYLIRTTSVSSTIFLF